MSWLSIRTFRRPTAVGISVGDDEGLPVSSVPIHDPSKSLTLAEVLHALCKRGMTNACTPASPPARPPPTRTHARKLIYRHMHSHPHTLTLTLTLTMARPLHARTHALP